MEKKCIYLLMALLMTTSPLFAVNLVNGWYLGVVGGGSFLSSVNFTTTREFITSPNQLIPEINVPGQLNYSAGGNFGIPIGYRWQNYRLEAEFLLNYNNFDKLTMNNTVIPQHTSTIGTGYTGYTYFLSGLVNGFVEFHQKDPFGINTNFSPYVGIGIGYASVASTINLYYNKTHLFDNTEYDSVGIGQAIVGASYFLDDYTSIGIDYRYIKTANISTLDSSLQVNTINLNFNVTLDSPS